MKRAILVLATAAFACAGQPLVAGQARDPMLLVSKNSPPRPERAAARDEVSTGKPRITSDALVAMEREIDHRIQGMDVNDPWDLLGATRGVYLNGFGVVFTSEVNLVISPMMPFRIVYTPEQIAKMHARKLARLPVLKTVMRDMLVRSAVALEALPANEQVAIGVTLYCRSWEDRGGIPQQVVMRARKQDLAGFQAGRISKEELDRAIRVDEL
ncbi:MAG: hypothetical protein ABSG25_12385 [Bryobacteraceae bacterium]